ncbi:hypothetical protein EW146_g748 [Bondarzewia mesenterica]|uniref:F-box domain-containing protein n=1 Tax=Bondarzewia mesenterica TaxID=1095465 RepID=A0A4S4M5V0_9AGAM|nr:hypothetical protein EW146_g748 [Bondarzewia mesenterica]
MAVIDSFKANTTSVDFQWPANVTGIERIMLSAHGDLQRLLSAFFARTITIKTIYSHTSPRTNTASPEEPLTQRREVHLVCNHKTVCVATSTVTITSPHCERLFLDEKFAIGQMFRKVGKVPEFALLDCGTNSDDGNVEQLWRRYILAMDGFECDITETWPDRQMFIRNSWVEEGVAESNGIDTPVAVEESKQRYAASQAPTSVSVRVQYNLPNEILDQIVKDLLECSGHAFSSVANFSLASHKLRQIALRSYFSSTVVRTCKELNLINRLRGWFLHVRRLTTTTSMLVMKSLTLVNMHLTCLEISFTESLPSLHPHILLLAPQLPKTLICLKLSTVPKITRKLLITVAEACEKLEMLQVSVYDGLAIYCCTSCLEDSASAIIHSPIGNDFGNYEDLTATYATPLKSLRYLRHLSLGVFLSHDSTLYRHFGHNYQDPICPHGYHDGSTWAKDDFASASEDPITEIENGIRFSSSERKATVHASSIQTHSCGLPSSICNACFVNNSNVIAETELFASMRMAQQLKSLETIRWASWFTASGSAGEPWTKLWISRKDGMVKVRRNL